MVYYIRKCKIFQVKLYADTIKGPPYLRSKPSVVLGGLLLQKHLAWVGVLGTKMYTYIWKQRTEFGLHLCKHIQLPRLLVMLYERWCFFFLFAELWFKLPHTCSYSCSFSFPIQNGHQFNQTRQIIFLVGHAFSAKLKNNVFLNSLE